MSIRKTINVLKNLDRFLQEANDPSREFYTKHTTRFAKSVQRRLINGILQGKDINNKPFKPLSDLTMKVRQHRGVSGRTPLRADNDADLKFLQSKNAFTIRRNTVFLNIPEEKYLMYHNVGFQPKYIPGRKKDGELKLKQNGSISFRRNNNPYTKMLNVPARTWWGIPNDFKEDGSRYNQFLKRLVKTFEDKIEEITKKG